MNRQHVIRVTEAALDVIPIPSSVSAGRYRVRVGDYGADPVFALFNQIMISISFLEYLWWVACLRILEYAAIFPAFEAYRNDMGRRPLAEFDPRIRTVRDNYSSSKALILGLDNEPVVEDIEIDDVELDKVDGLFQRALAWIVYHETAHFELDHRTSIPENELDADRFATETIMQWPSATGGQVDCMCGVITALQAVISIEHSRNDWFRAVTHPPAYQRLTSQIDCFDIDGENHVFLFAIALLQGELIRFEADLSDEPEAASLKESFDYHVTKIEELASASG